MSNFKVKVTGSKIIVYKFELYFQVKKSDFCTSKDQRSHEIMGRK